MGTASRIRGLEKYAVVARAEAAAKRAKASRHELDRVVKGSAGCWARCHCGWTGPLFTASREALALASHGEHAP